MLKSESLKTKKAIVAFPHQLGTGSDKPGLGLKLSQYSQLKGSRFRKEESKEEEEEEEDTISQSSSDVDSPNTKEQKRLQLIKEKEHMTNRMLSDFRQFVMLQKRQFSLNPDSDDRNSSDISSSIINNQQIQRGNSSAGPAKLNTQTSLQIMDPNESVNSGRSLTKQASNTSMFVPGTQQQQIQSLQNSQPISQKSIQISSQTISVPKEKQLLRRQNSIAQAMQKRLKIMHKSKEQLFNEKLKMFKGVSTYVETKQFLQGLNVLNSKKIAEDMQQNIKLNNKYEIIHQHLQQYKNEAKVELVDEDEAKRQRLAHVKYSKDNPLFQKNLLDLLGKAHDVLQNTPAPVSESEVKATQLFSNVKANIEQDKLVSTYEFSDENQFFDKLREELIKGKRRGSMKEEENSEEVKKKVLRRTREQQILNEIYTSTELVEQLSQQQIKEFINQRIEKEMNPDFDPFKSIPSKVVQKQLKNLNINEKTNLDSKTLYSEYVEKANQVRSRLHRLNQAFFKQKWANAMMKSKQEKEQIRNKILQKIQNAEINSSKIDVLFPGKKKMGYVRSRVDSGLNNEDYEEQNKIHNSPSPSQRQVDTSMHKNPSMFMDSPKSNHTIGSNTHIRVNSRQNIPKIISNINSGATSLNAISNINTAYSANFMNKNQNILDTMVLPPNLINSDLAKKEISYERRLQSQSFVPFSQNNSNQSGKDLNKLKENSFGPQNLIKKHSHTVSVPTFQKMSLNSFYVKPFLQKPINNPMSKTHSSYHHHSANTSAHFLPLPQNLSRLGSIKQSSNSIFNNTAISIDQHRFLKNDSNRSLRKITSIHYQDNAAKDQSKQQLTAKQSPLPLNLRGSGTKKMSNSPRNSSLQSQFIEQTFELDSQKERLNALLGGIEAQRASRKKESKQIGKELSDIQINCEEDLRKLKGEPIDHIQNVLDINFFKLSKDDRAHISDGNIKRFLYKND